jgi:hypothetical protein
VAGDCAAVPRRDEWLPALVLLADAASDLEDTVAGATLVRAMSEAVPAPRRVARARADLYAVTALQQI